MIVVVFQLSKLEKKDKPTYLFYLLSQNEKNGFIILTQ